MGLVAAARPLPLVLFLLIGGAVADRLPRHRVMVAVVGPGRGLAADSVAFAVAGPLRAFLDVSHIPVRAKAQQSPPADLREGRQEFGSRP